MVLCEDVGLEGSGTGTLFLCGMGYLQGGAKVEGKGASRGGVKVTDLYCGSFLIFAQLILMSKHALPPS